MPTRPRRRVLTIATAATVAAVMAGSLSSGPGRVGAVEPHRGSPLPAEPPAVVLSDSAAAAIVFDIDADGAREIVAVVPSDLDERLAAVRAWTIFDDGTAEASGQAPIRRSGSAAELNADDGPPGIDDDGMVAAQISDPAQFLVARRAGVDVLLVAAARVDDRRGECCLTIWEVTPEPGGGIGLRRAAETQRRASQLAAVDVDGDGTDEIFVVEGPPEEVTHADVALLRWAGTEFTREAFQLPDVMSWSPAIVAAGETDGHPGGELLVSGNTPQERFGVFQDAPVLLRITLRDGAPMIERHDLESQIDRARAIVSADGPIILTSSSTTLRLWSWPRDQRPAELASRSAEGGLIAVFGAGDEQCVALSSTFDFFFGSLGAPLEALPCDLDESGGRSISFETSARKESFEMNRGFINTSGPSYFGPVPGGLPGSAEAYIAHGVMLTPSPDVDALVEARDVALLPGLAVVGTAGRQSSWAALIGPDRQFAPDPSAGRVDLWAPTPATLRYVLTASIVEPEAADARLDPTFHGAVPDPAQPPNFLMGNGAVDLEIRGPVGTQIFWTSHLGEGNLVIGPGGVARFLVLDAPEPGARDGSRRWIRAWVVTPAGHGYAGQWRMKIHRQPPALDISGETPLLDLEPVLTGLTVPGATLTVNGEPAVVDDEGAFRAPVHVGILPTELRVVATDRIGNRAERLVTRVWPLDYRQLPFVPIVVLVTVAAAAALFLRRPEAGPGHRSPDDDATFEEIGG